MTRKKETPASATEAKTPAATPDASDGQPVGAGLPISTDATPLPSAGEPSAPATAPAPEVSEAPVPPQAAAGPAPDSSAVGEGGAIDSVATAVVAGDPVSSAHSTLVGANAEDGVSQPTVEEQAPANPNPVTLQIYPMRSYMDEGELRRRGGPGYEVERRHGEELVQRHLAALTPLEE